jgi:hypothetical protein
MGMRTYFTSGLLDGVVAAATLADIGAGRSRRVADRCDRAGNG